MSSMFEGFEVVHTYTRAQALEDGTLVDVTQTAREAGFRLPAALTRAVWEECVAWPEDDGGQDEKGRLWDVLVMAVNAARQAARQSARERVWFEVMVVPQGRTEAVKRTLTLHIGPGDRAEPVATVLFPGED